VDSRQLYGPQYWSDFPEILDQANPCIDLITSHDGAPLHVCHLGAPSSDNAILLMPPMTPLFLVLPMLVELSRTVAVTTWEPRGFITGAEYRYSHSMRAYAQDAECVIASTNVKRTHLICWCASADVAALLYQIRKCEIESVALLSPLLPSDVVDRRLKTFARSTVQRVVEAVNETNEYAHEAFKKLQLLLNMSSGNGRNSALDRLVRLNFNSFTQLCERNRANREFYEDLSVAKRRYLLKELTEAVPTCLICFEDDDVVEGPDPWLKSTVPNLLVERLPAGGHYAPFKEPLAVCSSLIHFYRWVKERRGASKAGGDICE